MNQCLKCGAPRPAGATECPECGVIYARVERQQTRRQGDQRATLETRTRRDNENALGASIMINCPTCSRPVSRAARVCPFCGHPVAGAQGRGTPPEQQAGKTKISPVVLYGGGFIALCVLLCLIGTLVTGNSSKPTAYSNADMNAMLENAKKRVEQQTRVVSLAPDTFGCHDLDDMLQMAAIARAGNKSKFNKAVAITVRDERCGFVRDRVVTAFFGTDPSGYVHVKDSQGSLWWVNPSTVEE